MTGGSERGAGDKDGPSATAQVPIGWRRTVENGAVVYISPSGTILSSVEDVGSYLLTDGTCKCGLECPLVVHKVFNFDPGAALLPRSQLPGKAEEDMTKLCNHRRKVVAMAALCRSMQASQLPLAAHSAGGPYCSMEGRDLRVGPLGAWEEGGWGPYPPRPRPSAQPKLSPGPAPPHPSLSFPFNGSLPPSRPIPNPASGSRPSPRKPPPPAPSRPSFSCYGPSQRYPRPPGPPQTSLQSPRPARTPEPPAAPPPAQRLGLHPHPHACALDPSLSSPPPSSSSPGAAGSGRPGPLGHPQVGSPPPFSASPSPSGSQDCPSPRQRSRHSSASSSSLSEPGAAGAYAPGGPKPPPCPSHSPKPLPPVSPRSRLEGMLQQYKDTPPQPQPPAAAHSNQSNFQPPHNHLVPPPPPPPPPFPPDRKSAAPAGANANAGAGFLGQLLSHQKQHQHASSFPASSLLSAAAKAQLASQKSQSQSPSRGTNANANAPGGAKEAQQSKVLISTLHSSARTPPSACHALLIPHSSPSSSPSPSPSPSPSSSSSPRAPRPPPDKATAAAAQHRRQRRSPTVLSMLKESQLHGPRAPPSAEPSSPLLLHPPHPENHHHHHHHPGPPPRQPADGQDGKRAAPAPPLSALLHLLSIQSTQASASAQAGPAPSPASSSSCSSSSPGPSVTLPVHYQAPPTSFAIPQQPQSFSAAPERPARPLSAQTLAPVGVAEELMDGGPKLGQNSAPGPGHALAVSQSPGSQDVGGQILSLLGQLCSGPLEERGPEEPGGGPMAGHNAAAGTLVTLDSREPPETRLPGACIPGAALAPPPSPGELAESFPLLSQDQLLQLLSAHSGLPSLLAPPFLGSLPIGLWMGGGQTQAPPPGPQTPPPAQLNILPAMLGSQGELPVNLLGLLNAPPPPPAGSGSAPSPSPSGAELGEKPGALQALLTASLLLGQQQAAALLPLAALGQPLDLLLQQQPFPAPLPEGVALEKAASAGLADAGPGLLDALQSLLLPPPPAFLSLSPALLAATLGLPDAPASHQPLTPQPQPAATQVTLSSPALGSTSVSCASLIPSPAPDVADALTTMSSQGKANALPAHLLPPLLGPGVLGDLAALGNMGSLHGMMGAGPLLLPPMQAPGLGVPLLQSQAAGLNPLACLLNNLQLNMGPALSMGGEKPMGMHEATSPAPQDNISANQLAQEPVPNPSHALGPPPQQREGPAGGGALLDPYSSFMDTIYTSFLQVSGRSPEGGGDPGSAPPPAPPPSFLPGEALQSSSGSGSSGGPPSLSPRRACSLRNPDLSRLGMETAQSPARGTPKPSEDGSATPTPPLSQRSQPPAPPPPAFPEEAKTDCGSGQPYSNGLPLLEEGEGEGAGQEGRRCEQGEEPPGYHGPPQGVNGTAENHAGHEHAEGERVRAHSQDWGSQERPEEKASVAKGTTWLQGDGHRRFRRVHGYDSATEAREVCKNQEEESVQIAAISDPVNTSTTATLPRIPPRSLRF